MTSDERIKICQSCEFYWKVMKTCKKCGCFLPAKALLKSSSCPLKKW